jgi:hypothetical protein
MRGGYRTSHNTNSSLCTICNNYFCSWIQEFKPVEGWIVDEHKINKFCTKGDARKIISYHVIECPEFIKMNERRKNNADS